MKTALLLKHSGAIVPVKELERVLHEAAPTCLGIACYSKGSQVGLLTNHWPALQDVGPTMSDIAKEILQLQEENKDSIMLLAFSDNAGHVTADGDGFDTPDMQPYTLLYDNEAGHSHLVCAILGDYSQFKSGDEHPAESFAVKDTLMPRLGEVFSLVDGDLPKLLAQIRSSAVLQKDIKNLSLGDTGIITFLASTGDILTINKRDADLRSTDWGWSTHLIAAPKAADKPAPEKKKGMSFGLFGGGKPKSEGTPVEKPVPVEGAPKVDPAVPISDPAETDTAAPVLKRKVKCPSHVTGKQTIRNWYQANAGFVPDSYKNKPEVDVQVTALKDFADLKDNLDNKQAAIDNGSATSVKDTAAKHVPAAAGPVTHGAPKTNGIIPVEEKDRIMKDGIVLKIVDRSSQVINSIEKIRAEEEKIPSFHEQLPKIALEGLLAATPADFEHIIKEFPKTAVSILMSYRSAHLKLKDMERAEADKKKKEEPAPTVAATNPNTVKPRLKLNLGTKAA